MSRTFSYLAQPQMSARYGYCCVCGDPIQRRQTELPDGDDVCVNEHRSKTSRALTKEQRDAIDFGVQVNQCGTGSFVDYVKPPSREDGKWRFNKEKRREFELGGMAITEIVFPLTDNKTRTVVWCRTPFEQAYLEIDEKILANYLFHINYEHHTDDDLNKAICKVEKRFKEYWKL